MSGLVARYVFLAICLVVAVLLLLGVVTPLFSGTIFAVSLVLLGLWSRGFTRPSGR